MARVTIREVRSQIASARERDRAERSAGLRALAARYDHASARVVLELTNGYQLSVPTSAMPVLADAPRQVLAGVAVSPGGHALLFDAMDVHCSVSALVLSLGAREIGRRGGSARTIAKRRAARINGAKGGRPRKKRRAA